MRKIALKIYQNQVKNLNKNKKDKEDVLNPLMTDGAYGDIATRHHL